MVPVAPMTKTRLREPAILATTDISEIGTVMMFNQNRLLFAIKIT
jgi:hypothetical protein